MTDPKALTTEQILDKWNSFAPLYTDLMDESLGTFYVSMINFL